MPEFLDKTGRLESLEGRETQPMSGFYGISCLDCQPSVWAFHIPALKSEWNRIFGKSTLLPVARLHSVDAKPAVGVCVDYPSGICPESEQGFVWKPPVQ